MITQSIIRLSEPRFVACPSCSLNYIIIRVLAEQALGARKAEGEKSSSEPCR